MPLSTPPVSRQPLHTRSIQVQAYEREDGFWDIEAQLVDNKKYDFTNREGHTVVAGDPVHDMHVRVTIDADYTIVAAQAAYDAAPYGQACSAIADAYQGLVGANLVNDFRRAVKARFSRLAGCTHMTELLLVLPTAAVQSLSRHRAARRQPEARPFQLDGCHALRTDGEMVRKYYPRWYAGASGFVPGQPGAEQSFTHTSTGKT